MRKLGTLFIILPIFSLAMGVHAQVSDSPSPPASQTIPTPAATTSPENPAISLAELALENCSNYAGSWSPHRIADP